MVSRHFYRNSNFFGGLLTVAVFRVIIRAKMIFGAGRISRPAVTVRERAKLAEQVEFLRRRYSPDTRRQPHFPLGEMPAACMQNRFPNVEFGDFLFFCWEDLFQKKERTG